MSNIEKTRELSDMDAIRLMLDILPDNETEYLLNRSQPSMINSMLASEDVRKNIIKGAKDDIEKCELLISAVNRIHNYIEDKQEKDKNMKTDSKTINLIDNFYSICNKAKTTKEDRDLVYHFPIRLAEAIIEEFGEANAGKIGIILSAFSK